MGEPLRTMSLHSAMAGIVVLMCLIGAGNHVLVISAVLKKCDWKKHCSLLLIVSLAVCDFVNLLLHAFGGVEASLGRFIAPKWLELIFGHIHNLIYGVFCAHLVSMSINRFCGVFFLGYFKIIFSRKRTLITIACCWIFGLAYSSLRFFVCCRVIYSLVFITFGYDFTHTVGGFVPLSFADFAVSGLSVVVPATVYMIIAFRLRQVGSTNTSQIDIKLCWQFVLILFAHLLYILTWQLVPNLTTDSRYFYFISFASVINFSINPFIYYIFNKSIRKGAASLALSWVPCLKIGMATVHPINELRG